MSATITAALQRALAAEQQAAFGYGLLGPHLRGSDLTLAVACSDEHELLRDTVAARIAGLGESPVAPLPDYPSLYPVDSAAAARTLAVRLEDDCAAAWRWVYDQSAGASADDPATRRQAQQQLTAAAVRSTRWRVLAGESATVAFPGS